MAVQRRAAKAVSFAQPHDAVAGLAEPRRIRQHGLEHRLQLAGRAGDDAEHLRGRGLLLQRLGQLARARLHLVEQPHVLDRDHRLVGEGGDQLDLLLAERLHLGTTSPRSTPMASPSRRSGTERIVRWPMRIAMPWPSGTHRRVAVKSCTCTGSRSTTLRPAVPGSGDSAI